jgi:hypothetical protein
MRGPNQLERQVEAMSPMAISMHKRSLKASSTTHREGMNRRRIIAIAIVSDKNLTDKSHQAGLCTRAGLPKTVAPAGTSRVTTLPAPMSAPSPILIPGRMIAPPPVQTFPPIADAAVELQTSDAQGRVARMIGREDLHRGTDLRSIADADCNDIEDHAVEVEKDPGAEADIEAVVAMKRWPDRGTLANKGEAFNQKFAPFDRGGPSDAL